MSTTFSIHLSLPGNHYLSLTLSVGAYFGKSDDDDEDDPFDLEGDDLDLEESEG